MGSAVLVSLEREGGASFRKPTLKSFSKKCRKNDFQNASFVLSGRLSVGWPDAAPSLIAAPLQPEWRGRVFFPPPLTMSFFPYPPRWGVSLRFLSGPPLFFSPPPPVARPALFFAS